MNKSIQAQWLSGVFLLVVLLIFGNSNVKAQSSCHAIERVVPAVGYAGETMEIEILGRIDPIYTNYQYAEFDFGPGITVTNIVEVRDSAYSCIEPETSLFTATLTIAGDAPLGTRDVKGKSFFVHGGDPILWEPPLLDGFEVKSRPKGAGLAETTLITTGAALKDGEVWVWGFRGSSQQGNGTMVVASNAPPAKVQSLSNVMQLAGGAYHLLALDASGDVYGWGQSGYGETGCTPTQGTYISTPCKVLSNAVQIATGKYYSIALDENGQVWTWGQNLYGQLGNGSNKNSRTPVAVNLNGEKTRLIGGAYEGAFAVTEEGHVWAWGDNEASGLGFQGSNYGVQRIVRTPTRVPNLDQYANDIVYIAGGNGWGEALLKDDRVIGWGLHAALGIGVSQTNISSPEPVVIMDNVSKLFARYVGSFALTNNGKLFSWGQTSGSAFPMIYGHTATSRDHSNGNVVAIGGGEEHLFYQTDDGKLYGVGYNDLYKLDQSKCCSPWIEWPGKEITFQ